jgi:hypothetical protein
MGIETDDTSATDTNVNVWHPVNTKIEGIRKYLRN